MTKLLKIGSTWSPRNTLDKDKLNPAIRWPYITGGLHGFLVGSDNCSYLFLAFILFAYVSALNKMKNSQILDSKLQLSSTELRQLKLPSSQMLQR